MKPGFYVCGRGSKRNCRYWDDINGCWQEQVDVIECPYFDPDGLEEDDE